jgi:cyclic-di-GMP phosphodiesterase, flagellum assembly factor TipF
MSFTAWSVANQAAARRSRQPDRSMRLGAIFIAVCMAIIAGSAGAIGYLLFGFSASESITVALAALTAAGVYNTFSTRMGMRTAVSHQLTDLSRGGSDLARQVAEIGRRLSAVEGKVEGASDKTRTVTDPITAEIDELGTLVKQLAETVAGQQAAIGELAKRPPTSMILPAPAFGQAPRPSPPEMPAEPAPPAAAEPAAAAAPSLAEPSKHAPALTAIRGAIEANRVDLYLQPIVTLPQRKVRFYEAMSRLRSEHGDVLHAADFIAQAESAGLMPKIDNLVVFRCVQVVRRLLLKNREIGLFCNLSGSTLTDSAAFPQFMEFMDANRAIAPSLLLEFTQAAVRAMGPIEHESLAALAERGFRFSMDNVSDMRIEPRELAARGFRFIKVPASFLLNRGTAATDIHPADLSDLVGRFGIDLVADKIESEGAVVDLLDYDVRFGQGFLFSPPRPVRAEALQGITERSDVIAREAPAAKDTGSQPSASLGSEAGKEERTTGLSQLARGFVSRG